MTEPAITPELVAKHNLTRAECARDKRILGREQSLIQLGSSGGKDALRISRVALRSEIGGQAA